MRNRYSILLGTVVVSGLFFLSDTIFWNNSSITTNLFILTLLAGGYLVTYTSSTVKSRTAIFSGFTVGIVLIIYQILFNKMSVNPAGLLGYMVLPGFFMMLGGFTAKVTKNQMSELVDHFIKRNNLEKSKNIGK